MENINHNEVKENQTTVNDSNIGKGQNVIDLGLIFQRVWLNKKRVLLVAIIAFVASILIIVPVPRYYTTITRVSPEMDSGGGMGAISSIAAQFGFDLADAGTSTDAISPLLYPDLMDDNGFVSTLFEINVVNSDESINTNYYDYLCNYRERFWLAAIFEKLGELMPKPSIPEIKVNSDAGFNPYILNRKQDKIMQIVRENIEFSYDKQTSVITIEVTDQDRLISKTLADSVRNKLMAFITEYRTTKARNDVQYYQDLVDEAKVAYDDSRHQFAAFSDANTGVGLPSVRIKIEDLENDMQLKYNTYTALSAQLQAARSKLRERTPAFTVLQGAEVPIKPTGPKRMIFVIAMTFLSMLATCAWVSRDILIQKK